MTGSIFVDFYGMLGHGLYLKKTAISSGIPLELEKLLNFSHKDEVAFKRLAGKLSPVWKNG